MSRQSRTKLVPPKTEPENQALEILEESSVPKCCTYSDRLHF